MPAMAVNNQTSTSGPATTGPVGPEDHPERPWTLGDRAHHARGDAKQLRDDHQDDQMAKAPQQQQRQQQPCLEPVEDPPGADGRQRPRHPYQPWGVEPGQPADHRVIGDGHLDGDQPPDPAGLQVIRQRRWLPCRPPATRRPKNPCRSAAPRSALWCRLVCGHVHGPSPTQGDRSPHQHHAMRPAARILGASVAAAIGDGRRPTRLPKRSAPHDAMHQSLAQLNSPVVERKSALARVGLLRPLSLWINCRAADGRDDHDGQ
jgi:hypothetical protein